jgi:hypothetical protein
MKNKFLKSILASFIVLINSVANAGLINLIDNGDFEADYTGQNVPSWVQLTGGNSGSNIRTFIGDTGSNQVAYMQGHNSGYSLSQTVNVSAGVEYDFSFDWGEGGDAFRDVYLRADIYENGSVVASSDWLTAGLNTNVLFNQQFSFTPTSGLIDVRFQETSARRVFVFIDNVSLTTESVPEPSTLAIFALGMMGLASRRFKKQS